MNAIKVDLMDKVAVVTGSNRGIGRGIAEGLADAGASIAIAARRLDMCTAACRQITERTGVKTFPGRCDVTRGEDIRNLVNEVILAFGHIDILVNNSGTGGSEKPILKMPESKWDQVLDINLKGRNASGARGRLDAFRQSRPRAQWCR